MSSFLRALIIGILMPVRLPHALRVMKGFRDQLYFGLAAAFVPPAAVAGLFLYGSSTGCSGGDCTGAMILVGILGIAAIPISLGGLVWTAIVLVGELIRRLRHRGATY